MKIEVAKQKESKWQVSFHKGKELYSSPCTLQVGTKELEEEKTSVVELFAKIAKELARLEVEESTVDVGEWASQYGIAILKEITEGLLLGSYTPVTFPPKVTTETVVTLTGVVDVAEAVGYVTQTTAVVQGVLFARDMVNMPGNKLRPLDFAAAIKNLVAKLPVTVEVIEKEKLREMGMNGLLAVGESSAFDPCLVVLRYEPLEKEKETIGLVGKGVTCDTGGYCLKAAGSMKGIKGDMAGGAAVAGAIYALAENGIQQNVVAVIPMCENRISTDSLLPGDVYTTYDGTTVEVLNTDAEGRLILADAVSYAVQEVGVSCVVDIATLTGAVVNMLGFSIAGLLTNDEALYEDFMASAQVANERYWRLPYYKEHEQMIKSKIADIKNIGEAHCGTITAGLFIKHFVKQVPWIHLDIAGTAWVDAPIFGYQSTGATGFGVATLYYLCSQRG